MAHTDTASRVVAAPADQVYAALIDPEALAAWLPPVGMSGRFERFEARPGGTYRMVLTCEDASGAPGKAPAETDVVESNYVELVPGRRVVQSGDFASDDPAFAGTMTTTWTLDATDAGTRLTIRADGVPDSISSEDHAVGMASSLANLAEHVGTTARRA